MFLNLLKTVKICNYKIFINGIPFIIYRFTEFLGSMTAGNHVYLKMLDFNQNILYELMKKKMRLLNGKYIT